MLAMGIDIGTTSLSMVMLDAQTGALAGRLTANTEAFVSDGHPGGRTQDPEKICRLVREGMAELLARPGRPGRPARPGRPRRPSCGHAGMEAALRRGMALDGSRYTGHE